MFDQFFFTTEDFLLMAFLAYVLLSVILWFPLRKLRLWYWKINQNQILLESIDERLQEIEGLKEYLSDIKAWKIKHTDEGLRFKGADTVAEPPEQTYENMDKVEGNKDNHSTHLNINDKQSPPYPVEEPVVQLEQEIKINQDIQNYEEDKVTIEDGIGAIDMTYFKNNQKAKVFVHKNFEQDSIILDDVEEVNSSLNDGNQDFFKELNFERKRSQSYDMPYVDQQINIHEELPFVYPIGEGLNDGNEVFPYEESITVPQTSSIPSLATLTESATVDNLNNKGIKGYNINKSGKIFTIDELENLIKD